MSDVSIVTATRNGEALIGKHFAGVSEVLNETAYSYEILYVDDGSGDRSVERVEKLAFEYPCVRGVFLDRSYGQQTALFLGMNECRSGVVVTIDVDLEVPATCIPGLLEEIENGADFVNAHRTRRAGKGWIRTLGSWVFNARMRKRTGLPIRDFGCGATALTRVVIAKMNESEDWFCGLKDLAGHCAEQMRNVPVTETAIKGHISSYGFNQLFRSFWVEHSRKKRFYFPEAETIRRTPLAQQSGSDGTTSGRSQLEESSEL